MASIWLATTLVCSFSASCHRDAQEQNEERERGGEEEEWAKRRPVLKPAVELKRQAVTINGTGPDLQIEDIWVNQLRTDPSFPSAMNVFFRVVNYGLSTTNAFNTTITIPGVSTATLSSSSLDGKATIGAVVGGVPGVIYMHETITPPAGSFTVTVTVDSANTVNEGTFEGNNTASVTTNQDDPPVSQWSEIGPRNITDEGVGASGKLYRVVLTPGNLSRIFVLGENQGDNFWRTNDGGSVWTQIAGSAPPLAGCFNDLAVDPVNTSQIYVLSFKGFFRSTDTGSTWKIISTHAGRSDVPARLIIDPTTPKTMYTNGGNGVFRSVDGGYNWTQIFTPNAPAATTEVVMPKGAANTLYVLVKDPTVGGLIVGVYKTTTANTAAQGNWTRVGKPNVCGLPILDGANMGMSVSGTTVFLLANGAIYKSNASACVASPGALSFTKTTFDSTKLLNGLVQFVASDPSNANNIYAAGAYFASSKDGGNTFAYLGGSGAGHDDHHDFAVDPANGNNIFDANDGGLYKSTNGGSTWTFIGNGVRNFQFHDMDVSASNPDFIIGGSQDSHTVRTNGLSTSWKIHEKTGDGAAPRFDPTNDQISYFASQYLNTGGGDGLRKKVGFADGIWVGCGLPTLGGSSVQFIGGPTCSYLVDPLKPTSLMLSCGNSMWVGDALNCAGNPPASPWRTTVTEAADRFSSVAVDAVRGRYYAGSNTGKLWVATASKGPWITATTGSGTFFLAGAPITSIAIDPFDPANVFVGTVAGGAGRIWLIRATGAANAIVTTTDITGNLPALGTQYSARPINTMVVDNNHPGPTVYIGTDLDGVFKGSVTGGVWSWQPYNTGFPRGATVSRLLFHPKTGMLRAATFGRGALEVAVSPKIGSFAGYQGKITYLRVSSVVGDTWGPPNDQLTAEVVVNLDTQPNWAFGLRLLKDSTLPANKKLLNALRVAFKKNSLVTLDAIRQTLTTALIRRVSF